MMPADASLPDLARAVEALLVAAGLGVDHPDVKGTPERVAKAWSEAFLSGYRCDPRELLQDALVGEGQSDLVVVRDLPFSGMCPHHLLPFVGKATVAYLPSDRLVGFGRLGDLVNCFTQRFTLQERACNEVVDALMEHLGARGAGCVMVGEHSCLRIPGNRPDASVVTASYRGEMQTRPELRDRVFAGPR